MHESHIGSTKMIATTALLASALLAGCTTDDVSSASGSGGAGGTTGSGASGGKGAITTGGGGSSSTGPSTCDTKALVVAAPIANFDGCTLGLSDEAATTGCAIAAIGGTSLFGGVFSYDDGTGNATFEIVPGHTTSGIELASTEPATQYGGGFGVWMSGCLDASAYKGITFWTRGSAPDAGKAAVSIVMAETIPATPPAGTTNRGTCRGTSDQCKAPKFSFTVTDSWTQVHAPWSGFAGGDANGTPVSANGNNIIQFQWDIGLAFAPDASGGYVAQPSAYELQIDDVAFE